MPRRDVDLGHWPNTLTHTLNAASGLCVAIAHGGSPDKYMLESLHSALIAAEECRQAMEEIITNPKEPKNG
jgi:hypothetical protein